MLFAQQGAFLGRPYAAPVAFRSKSVTTGAPGTVTKPAGVAVGDLVIVVNVANSFGTTPSTLTTASGSAWGQGTFGAEGVTNIYTYWYKFLNATDVSNAWQIASGMGDPVVAVAYDCSKGGSVLTEKADVFSPVNSSTAPTLTAPGFVPADQSHGIIAYFIDAETSASDTVPSGMTVRDTTTAGTAYKAIASDMLGNYEGQDLVWTGVAGIKGEAVVVWEVT
jgi:hypothetical protein